MVTMQNMVKPAQNKAKHLRWLFKVAAIGIGLVVSINTAQANDITEVMVPEIITGDKVYTPKTTSEFLKANRVVRLTGRVEENNAVKVIDQLYMLSEIDPTADIELRIHSHGGSVASGLAIYDAIQSIPNDVRTVCEGPVMSMGAFLLSVGAQGKRLSNPNCQIMYHQTSGRGSGKTSDREIKLAETKRLYERMLVILALHTGWSENDLEDLMINNLYLTPEEAKEMGLIDAIITPVKTLPTPAPRTKLPDNFCDKEERRHLKMCD